MQLNPIPLSGAQEVPVPEGLSQDPEQLAAQLLLARVEALIRQGQPRQAVSHIMDMTGVEKELADEFVEELKARVFG